MWELNRYEKKISGRLSCIEHHIIEDDDDPMSRQEAVDRFRLIANHLDERDRQLEEEMNRLGY